MRTLDYKTYLDKVTGCYIGKALSGNMGAPHEGVKMSPGLPFCREMVNPHLANDDLDLQVLWLDVVEEKGFGFTPADLLERFVRCCPYAPGEYAVMRKNYQRGILPPMSGTFGNGYYREGMGCPIRSEIWGCVAVGDPAAAAEFAARDGILDHASVEHAGVGRPGESVQAERFLAALESEAFFESDLHTLIAHASELLPPDSRFRECVRRTVAWCDSPGDMDAVRSAILFDYGHPDCTNMYQNMGITLAALLLGGGDPIRTAMLALNAGFDTDCTCATAGAILGIIQGAKALTDAYGLSEVPFVLGVESHRRSDRIADLAEDIARVGVAFAAHSGVRITDAPAVPPLPEAPVWQVTAAYDGSPSIAPGEQKRVTFTVQNRGNTPLPVTAAVETVHGLCAVPQAFSLTVEPGESADKTVTVSLPSDTVYIHDDNVCVLHLSSPAGEINYRFGLAGAVPWKLCGPFWRTEPEVDTGVLLAHLTDRKYPYTALLENSREEGNETDKLRQFHLNFAPDLTRRWVEEDALFSPPAEAWRGWQERAVYLPEDTFTMDDLFGFRGPCTAYLSRIICCDEDTDCCVQVGHSAPFALYLNGEELARRDTCDNWTAENVHIGGVRLHKGENRLTLRLTRVNADAKYNVTFTEQMSCMPHIVGLISKNPTQWNKKEESV